MIEKRTPRVRVVQYGCGPIGCSLVRLASQKAYIELVGAIDRLEGLVGRDLGEVAGTGKKLGVVISSDAKAVLQQAKADVVLLATTSWLKEVYPQLETCIRAGANVVSTCEELAYPYPKQPELATTIDKLAKEHQVTVLGTGVNPGFLMDTWPLVMTAICQDVKRIKVARIGDATTRRLPFQKKIAAGCTVEEFKRRVEAGTLGHIGLEESIEMLADGLGWKLDNITEDIKPVVLQREVRSEFVTVKPGQAAGIKQTGHGFKNGEEVITLELQAYIGNTDPHDTVYITGTPNMEVTIKGSAHGDIATAAMVVNSIRRVIEAPPGLTTMMDLPIVSAS